MENNWITAIKSEIEEFKKTITKGPFKNRIHEGSKLDEYTLLDVYCDAIYQGYLDACRTFNKDEDKEMMSQEYGNEENPIHELAKKMKTFLDNKYAEFDHNDFCQTLIEKTHMTYGQAQKIVNMALKYLCCLEGAENYSDKFANCHMPLDSIMLEWMVRYFESYNNGDNKIIRGGVPSWSSMGLEISDEKFGYNYFVEKVNTICEEKKKRPLQLDFENWREMQLRLSAEAFLKAYYQEDDGRTYAKVLKSKDYKELVIEVNIKTGELLQKLNKQSDET